MYTMEKSRLLYERMAKRMEESDKEIHQAKVYREILEMMKDYDDLEIFMTELESSSLYLAPSYAIVKDKCEAYRLAAIENEMMDVAKIYEDKLIELEENPVAVMEPGFYSKAGYLKGKYLEKMQDFVKLYMAYYQLKIAKAGSEGTYIEELNTYVNKLSSYSGLGKFDGDFAQVSRLKEYRALIPATDEGYDKFIEETEKFLITSPNYTEESKIASHRTQEAWEEINKNKAEIILSLEENTIAKTKYALEIYLPPKDTAGSYSYVHEEVKDYE